MMRKVIKLFDVTLRDGLQTSKKIYTLNEKKNILNNIIKTYNPQHVEVGSIVSKKVLPQMEHSQELYDYALKEYPDTEFYLLIPNMKYLKKTNTVGKKNFSFITSVSEEFQKKNTKMDLDVKKNELRNIMNYIECLRLVYLILI